jgi:hypothetical protein
VASPDETWTIRGLEARVVRRDVVVNDGHGEERKLAGMTEGEAEIESRLHRDDEREVRAQNSEATCIQVLS